MSRSSFAFASMIGFAAFATSPSGAAIVAVTSPVALGANDTVGWAQLGSEGQVLTSPQPAMSTGGLSLTVADSDGTMRRVDQSSIWGGNFAPGAKLLWNNFSGTLTVNFLAPVKGVGAKIQSEHFGSFVANLIVNGGALGTFLFNGQSTAAEDDSAIFAGVLSNLSDISSVTFQMDGDPATSFAIGALAINGQSVAAVPEPATWTMIIGGFGLMGAATRRGVRAAVSYA